MGNCVGLTAKTKETEVDELDGSDSQLSDEELPVPIPMNTPRLSRQSAFSRASMSLPLNPLSSNMDNSLQLRLVNSLGGEDLSLSFDDEDDPSVVSPSVGRAPFDLEFDVADDSFVQSLLNNKKYIDFLYEKDERKHLENFKCSYCGHTLQDPVILVPCGHEYCQECFFKWKKLFYDQPDVPCPDCKNPVFKQWYTPAIRTRTYMTQKRFACKCVFSPQCKTTIPICRYKKHLKKCEYAPVKLEIKTFNSQESISLEMRKSDSARDCIDEITKRPGFDPEKKWFLHVGSPGSIAEDSKTVKEFCNQEVWVSQTAGRVTFKQLRPLALQSPALPE